MRPSADAVRRRFPGGTYVRVNLVREWIGADLS